MQYVTNEIVILSKKVVDDVKNLRNVLNFHFLSKTYSESFDKTDKDPRVLLSQIEPGLRPCVFLWG